MIEGLDLHADSFDDLVFTHRSMGYLYEISIGEHSFTCKRNVWITTKKPRKFSVFLYYFFVAKPSNAFNTSIGVANMMVLD